MESGPYVYIAGPLGFTEAGRHYHRDVLVPAVRSLGLEVLDPWAAGAQIAAGAAPGRPLAEAKPSSASATRR